MKRALFISAIALSIGLTAKADEVKLLALEFTDQVCVFNGRKLKSALESFENSIVRKAEVNCLGATVKVDSVSAKATGQDCFYRLGAMYDLHFEGVCEAK